MRKLISTLGYLIIVAAVFAQEPESIDANIGKIALEVNIEKDSLKEKEIAYPYVNVSPSFGLGVTGFLNEVESPEIPSLNDELPLSIGQNYGKSRSVMINLDVEMNLTKNFGFLSGIGLNIHNYAFTSNLVAASDPLYFHKDTVISYEKYRLKNATFQIPLMLKYQAGDFELAAGGTAEFSVKSWTKSKYTAEEGSVKGKSDFSGFEPIRLGVGGRMYYKSFGFFVNYGLNPMMRFSDSDYKYELRPFSAGLILKLS